jgi:hypothetical protein
VSERTCLYCGDPLEGVRRDALVHPHHAREWRRLPLAERRRRKGDATARVTPERPPEPGKEQAERALALWVQFMPWPCPDCGGDEFAVRVHERMVVGRDAEGRAIEIGPRKMLTCKRCGWRGSAAQARDAA